MSKQDAVIKLTRDGRFWAMGLVVDTFDDALARCERKAPGKNIHLEWPVEQMGNLSYTGGVCGPADYLRLFV